MENASPFLRLSLESAVVIDSMRIFGLVCAAPRTGAVALLAVLPLLQAQTGWPGFWPRQGGSTILSGRRDQHAKRLQADSSLELPMKRGGVPFRPSQSILLVVNGILYLSWPFNHVAAMENVIPRWQAAVRAHADLIATDQGRRSCQGN